MENMRPLSSIGRENMADNAMPPAKTVNPVPFSKLLPIIFTVIAIAIAIVAFLLPKEKKEEKVKEGKDKEDRTINVTVNNETRRGSKVKPKTTSKPKAEKEEEETEEEDEKEETEEVEEKDEKTKEKK